MAEENTAYTTYKNGGDDYMKKAASEINNPGTGSPKDGRFQTYPSKEVEMRKMFGKFNQQNTQGGNEMAGESRKRR